VKESCRPLVRRRFIFLSVPWPSSILYCYSIIVQQARAPFFLISKCQTSLDSLFLVFWNTVAEPEQIQYISRVDVKSKKKKLRRG
jgi:hypothetical protein